MSSFLSDMGKSFSKYLPSIGNTIVGGMERKRKQEDAIIQEQQADAKAKAKLEEQRSYNENRELEKEKKAEAEKQAENEASQKALQSLVSGKQDVLSTTKKAPKVTEFGVIDTDINAPMSRNEVPLTDVDKMWLEGQLTTKNAKSYDDYQKKLEDERKSKEVKYEYRDGQKITLNNKNERLAVEKIPQSQQIKKLVSVGGKFMVMEDEFGNQTETKIRDLKDAVEKEGGITQEDIKGYKKASNDISVLARVIAERKAALKVYPEIAKYMGNDGEALLRELYDENPEEYKRITEPLNKIKSDELDLQQKRWTLAGQIEANVKDKSWIKFANSDKVKKTIAENPLKGAEAILRGVYELSKSKNGLDASDLATIPTYVKFMTGRDVEETQAYKDLWESINNNIKGQ